MKQCVIFDLDGTLVDSMGFWISLKYRLCDIYFNRTGKRIDLTEEDKKAIEKLSCKGAINYINKTHGSEISYRLDEIDSLKEFYEKECEIFPYAKELLEQLRKNRVKMCLITATPEAPARVALRRYGLEKYFKFILTPQRVKGGKFHRPIFVAALLKLRCLPQRAVLIDDAAYAHKTAKRLGIRCVGVKDKHRQDNLMPHCDVVYDSIREIYEAYNKNNRL